MSPLYVSDLDGTLLRNDALLSEFSRRELNGLLAEGVAFSVASARSVASIRTVLQGVRLSLPVIEFNGAFISDLATGRHRVVNSLDPAVARDVYDTLSLHGMSPLVSTFNGTEDRLHVGAVFNAGVRWYVDERRRHRDRRLRHTRDMRAALRERVVCLTAIATREQLAGVAEELEAEHAGRVELNLFENRYSPGWYWLTVHDHRATKGQAVQTLMLMEGLDGRDLIVFGDELNDLQLFGVATEPVAVSNAVPPVLARAGRVIGSNEEDSVVRYVREHWGRVRRDVDASTTTHPPDAPR